MKKYELRIKNYERIRYRNCRFSILNSDFMPTLSVIIPTHRRSEVLGVCLTHLEKQTIANNLEVIVIDDAADDASAALCKNAARTLSVRYERVTPCQQGVARNRGIAYANAPVCLFIGDDILLHEECCSLHEQIHRHLSRPAAVLGSTGWDPETGITPVMEWLMRSGWQFGYPKIERYAGDFLPKDIQHLFSYTSNLSAPTEIAKRIPFLENVSLYGWEDVEWGGRLRNAGIPLFYEPDARALHRHTITMEDSLKRMETLGESVVRVHEIVPEFDRLPHGWKKIAYEILSRFPTMSGRHRAAFLRGIKKAKNDET